jgi:hypothetical protein
VLTISIATLKPANSDKLNGATVGEAHAHQVRDLVVNHPASPDAVLLDFARIQSATAS